MADDKKKVIVVKRIKKGEHGHHGGAWKVAYADFVTAMMAFFLLMWLLQAASQEQKEAISYYFTTGSVMDAGVGGGATIITGGMETIETVENPHALPFVGFNGSSERPALGENPQVMLLKEKEAFDRVKIALEEAIQSDPKLFELHDNIDISQNKSGLTVQLVDQLNQPIFESGTNVMTSNGLRLTVLLARVLKKMPNQIQIDGHTDAIPLAVGGGNYTNWELSTDRALAFRRAIVAAGVPEAQIISVTGRAATQPFDEKNPKSPQNRRISITLKSAFAEEKLNPVGKPAF